ncbi:hypothetical protein FOL47_003635, partial [Perkinsus chesapeaki]
MANLGLPATIEEDGDFTVTLYKGNRILPKIRLHPTLAFYIIAQLILFMSVFGLASVAIILVTVFLHEMGHVAAARLVGGHTDEVVLWPLGGLGVSWYERTFVNKVVVTMSGPIVNGLLFGIWFLAGGADFKDWELNENEDETAEGYIYLVVIALPKREELRGVPMGTLEDAFRLGVNVLPRSPGRSISDGEKMRIEGDRVGLEVLENGKAFEARAVFDGDEDDAVDLGTLFYIETTDGCKAYPEVCRASEGDSEEEVLTLEGRGWNKKRLRIDFECRCDNDVSLSVKWTGMVTAIERTESLVVTPVARVAVRIISDAPLELKSLLLLDIPLDDSKRSEDNEPYKTGVVDGSPVVIPERSLFCGLEHPRAKNTIDEGSGRVAGFIRRPILDFGYSAAVGKFDPRKGSSSLFKTFADYVEMIRAAPYHSWLHYNTWYDLRYKPCIEVEVGGKDPFCEYSKKFTEDNINQRIDAIATSLEKNGVKLDGVLLDDGWDDWDTLWGVNKKAFPRGDLSEVARRAQEKHGVKLGVWMSPFGG